MYLFVRPGKNIRKISHIKLLKYLYEIFFFFKYAHEDHIYTEIVKIVNLCVLFFWLTLIQFILVGKNALQFETK